MTFELPLECKACGNRDSMSVAGNDVPLPKMPCSAECGTPDPMVPAHRTLEDQLLIANRIIAETLPAGIFTGDMSVRANEESLIRLRYAIAGALSENWFSGGTWASLVSGDNTLRALERMIT